MTVYLVMRNYDYEGSVVLGVFSSMEQAEACKTRYVAHYGSNYLANEVDIDVWTVDQLPDYLLASKA